MNIQLFSTRVKTKSYPGLPLDYKKFTPGIRKIDILILTCNVNAIISPTPVNVFLI